MYDFHRCISDTKLIVTKAKTRAATRRVCQNKVPRKCPKKFSRAPYTKKGFMERIRLKSKKECKVSKNKDGLQSMLLLHASMVKQSSHSQNQKGETKVLQSTFEKSFRQNYSILTMLSRLYSHQLCTSLVFYTRVRIRMTNLWKDYFMY